MRAWPPWALDEEMLTIRPQPASIMSGTTAWQQSNVPVRLTARIRFHWSALIDRKGSKPWSPALFTRMVGRPRRRRTSATPASIWERSVTSTVTPTAVPPDATILAAVASAELVSRSKTATAAPSAASRSLMASPMPEPPPVTIAVRSSLIGQRPRLLRGASDAVQDQVPQLLGRVAAVGLGGGTTDRHGEGVEHDRLEDNAGQPAPAEVTADDPGGHRLLENPLEEGDERRIGASRFLGMDGHQLLGELRQRTG